MANADDKLEEIGPADGVAPVVPVKEETIEPHDLAPAPATKVRVPELKIRKRLLN